jgi:hypothetical protein
VVDRTAIIRSISHGNNGHFVAAHWCSTGYIGTTIAPHTPPPARLSPTSVDRTGLACRPTCCSRRNRPVTRKSAA